MSRSDQTTPRFLTLWQIRFPIGAIASIGHRISGVLLLIALPGLAIFLDRSLRNEADYEALLISASSPWMAPLVLIATWALAHHLLAGIRHLLMDMGIGTGLARARASAWTALMGASFASVLTTLWWLR